MEDVVKVMTEVEQRSAAAQRSSAVPLEPTCATSNPALSATNLLSELDHATQVCHQQLMLLPVVMIGLGDPPGFLFRF